MPTPVNLITSAFGYCTSPASRYCLFYPTPSPPSRSCAPVLQLYLSPLTSSTLCLSPRLPCPPLISLACMCVCVSPLVPVFSLPSYCPPGTFAVLLPGGGGAGFPSCLGRWAGWSLSHVVCCGASSLRFGHGEPAPGSVRCAATGLEGRTSP